MKRASTAADYSRRLVRVAEHIGENLDRRIELDELAEIACFSVYHFHRIYRAMMGETVHETAMRLRMQRASSDLKRSDRPMLEIARRAGYGSVAAFTRAFRGHFGAPPAAFRRQDSGQSGGDPSHSARVILEPVAIRQIPPLRIVAIHYKGPRSEIGTTFERLRAWARPRGLIGHWLPASGEEPADAPHYEFYVNDTHYTGPSDLVTELRLPLK